MLKGFKEFLARGNIVDLSIAVVIGTAFTALVTKFTDSIITPLISRIGAGGESDYGILQINIGGGQTIDLNILLSAAINFVPNFYASSERYECGASSAFGIMAAVHPALLDFMHNRHPWQM